jgi:DNA polymerase-1
VIFPPARGFDLETGGSKPGYGLQPFRMLACEAFIKSVATDREGKLYPSIDDMRQIFADCEGQYIVGWNVVFDAAWCIAAGLEEEVFAAKWLDAMLLWRHAVVEPEGEDVPQGKRKKYSLEAAMKEYFPEHADFKEFTDFDATDEASLKLLLHRNRKDAEWTLTLAKMFWDMLTEQQQRAALIEARCIPLMAKTRVLGLRSSAEEAQALSDILRSQAITLYRELLSTSPEVYGINLGSPKQLQTLLYDLWRLPATRYSRKTGDPSTDKYALFDLAALDPRAALLKKIREAKNNRTKYAEGTLKSLAYNGDGCVRPQAKVFSTYTSRITYGSSDRAAVEVTKETKKGPITSVRNVDVPVGVALHQWKRGKEYRRLIMPPEGYLLTEFDFAGQEFRWMAVASGDETMLSLCAPGEDAHGYMGAQISRRDYRELVKANKAGDTHAALDRKCGKFCNLSYQYRVSARTATVKARVEYEMDVDEHFIQDTQVIYKTSYPGVEKYWRSQIQTCKMQGYAETFAGRRVQLVGYWKGKNAWAMESTSINYPIQGTGGDQKYLALAVARNLLPEFDGYFYYELHDGLFFIFPEDKAVAASKVFLERLSTLPYKQAWGVDLPIQFPVDGKIGRSWGDLKDLDKWEGK